MPKLDVEAPPRRIADGCTRITLPDPFVPHVTSVFLIGPADAPWLVDSGADTVESVDTLDHDLATLGLSTDEASEHVLWALHATISAEERAP